MYGGILRIVNPTSSEEAVLALPAGPSWRGLGTPAGSRGYEWADRNGVAGPCTSIKVRSQGRIEVKCQEKFGDLGFTLDEPSQESLLISLRLGTADPQCATFGGIVTRDRGSANPGPVGHFVAKKAPPFSGTCP